MANPVICPKQPLPRELDVSISISRPQTEIATDMTMICFLTPNVNFSDGGNDRVRFYSTMKALTADVGTTSDAYFAGNAFFSRSEHPAQLCIGQIFENSTPAVLRGGQINLAQLKQVTNGGFDITVNGSLQAVRGLDFSSINALSDAATVVQSAMTGVTLSADSATGGLVMQTTATGDGAELSFISEPDATADRMLAALYSTTQISDMVNTLKLITDGSFIITYDNVPYSVTGVNFSTATDEASIGTLLQVAIRNAGLDGVVCHAGNGFILLQKEGLSTAVGFVALSAGTSGTDISSILKLAEADKPGTALVKESTSAQAATLLTGTSLDFSAISALGATATFKCANVSATVDVSSVTNMETLITALTSVEAINAAFTVTESSGALSIVAKNDGWVSYLDDTGAEALGAELKGTAAMAESLVPYTLPAYTPVAADDVSALLQMTESTAINRTVGYTPGDLVSEANLVATAASCAGSPIYGWIIDRKYRDTDEQKAFADWIEGRDPAIFIATTNSPTAYNTADSQNIGYYAMDKGYKRTGVIYHNNPQVYPDMSYLALALSVNYALANSTLTMKFKQLDGIEPSPLTETQLNALESRRINAYVYIGNTSRTVREGVQSLDTWFTDSLINLDNFKEELQVAVFNVFLRNKKVPYTNAGQDMLISAAQSICSRYTQNGTFADRDVTVTTNETGFETKPATSITPTPVYMATDSERAARIAPPIAITAYEAGAMHKVSISVSVYN